MNEQTPVRTAQAGVPATTEADRVRRFVEEDAGFDRMLKFNKGDYTDSDSQPVSIGTEFIAHVSSVAKNWIKFRDGTVKDRKLFRPGQIVPLREDLDDRNEDTWENGLDGRPRDPWVLQSLLPLEAAKDGEIYVFVTSSFGGKRAVGDLCKAWGRRYARDPNPPMPIIKLAVADMPTKKFGKVKRPEFKIIGYGDASGPGPERAAIAAGNVIDTKAEFSDEIPF